jgi:hypothetical protein
LYPIFAAIAETYNVLAQGRETLCGEASLWSGGLAK